MHLYTKDTLDNETNKVEEVPHFVMTVLIHDRDKPTTVVILLSSMQYSTAV